MSPRDRKDLFPGALEMMVLQTLQHQRMHGYALVQHIRRRSNDLLQVEEGSLYPARQRLLKDGSVKARWGVSATGAACARTKSPRRAQSACTTTYPASSS